MTEEMLVMLAAELDMHSLPEQRRVQLWNYLYVAETRISNSGIKLDFTIQDDVHLVVEYAAWLFRRRRQEASRQMPEYLRLDIHDRLISGKGRVSNG